MTVAQLNKVKTLSDLQALGIGTVLYSVGGRGGHVGLYSSAIANHFNVPEHYMPSKFGCYTNYLGGGIRGAITQSTFDEKITSGKAKLLNALAAACVRVYEDIENEMGMNDEEDEDGETNWEAKGTNAARNAGIISAY